MQDNPTITISIEVPAKPEYAGYFKLLTGVFNQFLKEEALDHCMTIERFADEAKAMKQCKTAIVRSSLDLVVD